MKKKYLKISILYAVYIAESSMFPQREYVVFSCPCLSLCWVCVCLCLSPVFCVWHHQPSVHLQHSATTLPTLPLTLTLTVASPLRWLRLLMLLLGLHLRVVPPWTLVWCTVHNCWVGPALRGYVWKRQWILRACESMYVVVECPVWMNVACRCVCGEYLRVQSERMWCVGVCMCVGSANLWLLGMLGMSSGIY